MNLKLLKCFLFINSLNGYLSSADVLPQLFKPITVRNITFKNRIWISPMQMCSAKDGFINDFYLAHLSQMAIGGASMVMIEATAVEPNGRISPSDPGIWNDSHIESYQRLTNLIKSLNSVAGIQLAHSGRKGSTETPWVGGASIRDENGGWPTIGPSPVEYGGKVWKVPKEATLEDMHRIKSDFLSAAKRAVESGFEVIELHFAHGYLVSTFLSPLTNLRKDQFGGSLKNRMRYALEIAQIVRKSVPHIVLGVRISVTDYGPNGWNVSDSIELSKELKNIGIDYIDCSSGFVTKNFSKDYAMIQRNASAVIQKSVGIKTIAVGKIIDPLIGENIIKTGSATFIMIGRAALNNPHWPYWAADVLNADKEFNILHQYDYVIGWNNSKTYNWRTDLKEQSRH